MSEPILESVDTPQHSGDPVTSDEFQYIWHAVIDEGTSVDHTFEDGDTDIVMTCL